MSEYEVSLIERIRELVLADTDMLLGPDDQFTYSWNHGYEQMTHQTDGAGRIEYGGAYHPDGFCWNGRDLSDPTNDGTGICNYCGRTLH